MEIEFDAAKDRANLAKHGVSLARAVDLDILADVGDGRFTEDRRRMYGLIDDCLIAWPTRAEVRSSAPSAFAART